MDFVVLFYFKEQDRRSSFIHICEKTSQVVERKNQMSIQIKSDAVTINEFALRLKNALRFFSLQVEDSIQIFGLNYRDHLLNAPLKEYGKKGFAIDNFGDFIASA